MKAEHPLAPVQGQTNLMEPTGFTPPPPEPEGDALRKLMVLMRGRWPWAIGLALVLGIGGAVIAYRVPEVTYRSDARVNVASQLRVLIYRTGEEEVPGQYGAFMRRQVNRVRSERVAARAYQEVPFAAETLREFRQSIQASHPGRSEEIQIAFEHTDPRVAEVAVAAVTRAFEEIYNEIEVTGTNQRLNQLDQRRDRLQIEADRFERDRIGLAEQYGTEDLGRLHQQKLDEVRRIEARVNELRITLAVHGAAEASRASAEADGPRAEDLTVEEIAAFDNRMARYVAQDRDLERDLAVRGLGGRHPYVRRARRQQREIEREIEERAAYVRRNYTAGVGIDGPDRSATVARLREQLTHQEALYEGAREEATRLGSRNIELESLKRRISDNATQLRDVERLLTQLEAEEPMRGRLEVETYGESAEVHRDRRRFASVMGLGLGGGLGGGMVLLVGLMDRRLRNMRDAHDNLGEVGMLGIMPRLPDDLSDPMQAALASHCVHQIRTLLQIGPDSNGRRVFAVTSPAPENGKTSLSLALGVSFAASGARTLLVDCDMTGRSSGLTSRVDAIIRRKIGRILQHEQLVTEQQIEQALLVAQESSRRLGETLVDLGYLSEKDLEQALTLQEQIPVGLLDALDGEALETCTAETGIDRLSILPIGGASGADVSRISSAQIGRLMDEARKRYDIVLFDTGPVPGSLEASHVSAEADATVLVVSRGQPRPQAEKALNHLLSIGARVAGLVFNRAEGRDVAVVSESSTSSRGLAPSAPRFRGASAAEGEGALRFGPVARAVASSVSAKEARNGNGARG